MMMFKQSFKQSGFNIAAGGLSHGIINPRLITTESTTLLVAGSSHHYSTATKDYIRIVDVSPRDGLQNEPSLISSETKFKLINELTKAGLSNVEVTSFVSPKWVPQMSDAKTLYPRVLKELARNNHHPVSYPVLIPNVKGFEQLLQCLDVQPQQEQKTLLQLSKSFEGANTPDSAPVTISIFGAASEGFSRKNTNRSVDESFDAFKEVMKLAKSHDIPVRGYLSTVIACPYDGPTKPEVVAKYTEKLLDMGCYEVSLGDTIGVGTPATIEAMLNEVLKHIPVSKLAIHAHDTYGQGVANVVQAVNMGIRVVDSSVAGLGGCPYAKGATGNVASEDVIYALHGLGYETGVDILQLSKIGQWISDELGRPNGAKAGKAILAKSG